MSTTTKAQNRSPAFSKLRAEWPAVARHLEVGEPIHQVRERVEQMPTAPAERQRILDVLDVLSTEVARGDFDDPELRAETNPANVMRIVHEEADAQNRWDVLGLAFVSLDQETGFVRFRHGAGQFGTAWFRWYPDVERGDRVLFEQGHYDMDWPRSAQDFCERLAREA